MIDDPASRNPGRNDDPQQRRERRGNNNIPRGRCLNFLLYPKLNLFKKYELSSSVITCTVHTVLMSVT
jgi:hypothetical protein